MSQTPQAGLLESKKMPKLLIPTPQQREDILKFQQDKMAPPKLNWVTQWIDFSFKYGMGFQMSNGVIGVHFNDNTKLMSTGESSTIKYVYRTLAKGDGLQD